MSMRPAESTRDALTMQPSARLSWILVSLASPASKAYSDGQYPQDVATSLTSPRITWSMRPQSTAVIFVMVHALVAMWAMMSNLRVSRSMRATSQQRKGPALAAGASSGRSLRIFLISSVNPIAMASPLPDVHTPALFHRAGAVAA